VRCRLARQRAEYRGSDEKFTGRSRRLCRRRNGQIANGSLTPHGYYGIETQVIDVIAQWIDSHR
jgi:hypothetical protein